eukprot:SAG31_NODE_40579_length_280_cov_0.574586_1_plen_78_part_10
MQCSSLVCDCHLRPQLETRTAAAKRLVWLMSIIAGATVCLSCGLQSAAGCGIDSTGYLVTTTTLSFDYETTPTGLRLQ